MRLLGAVVGLWLARPAASFAAEAVVAVVAAEPLNLCGGASLELERELRAAGFETVRVPRARGELAPDFDAVVWFSEAGDEIRLEDLKASPAQREVASLRVDCRQRLVRRRMWTLVVEMLWARTEGLAPSEQVGVERRSLAPRARARPSRTAPNVPGVDLSSGGRQKYHFGAAGVVGANAFATAPAWDLALIGGYRSPVGYRLGARLRWPVTAAEERTSGGTTRIWTFTGDLEAGRVFRRSSSLVQPYVGLTFGLHFTLLDSAGMSPWLDRRWAALHGRALVHMGVGFALPKTLVFCQLEGGLAHRLQAHEAVRSLDRGGDAFVAAVSLGVSFDY